MNVTVRSVGQLKTLLGQGEMPLCLTVGTTIDGLFACLGEMGDERLAPYVAIPDKKDAHLPVRVMVNGCDIGRLQGRGTVLEEGDDVLIFMPLAGG